ncbi:MAG: RnfABCDGE type electron transport complex subunit D [Sedimentisphaerales bacterium]|nr:RnfABCDGE type electron transport complex subunit D [Sedimentisphaerales bacterium]
MTEEQKSKKPTKNAAEKKIEPEKKSTPEKKKPAEKKDEVEKKILLVSSSPHLTDTSTSRRVMYEVVIGLVPAVVMAVYLFRIQSLIVLLSCLVGCVGTEWLFNVVRKKEQTALDGSAIVTALILGLSLPPTLPYWMAIVGSVVAIAIAKMVFGGLGANIFNPAMVGRAFLMACFGLFMTTWTLPVPEMAEQQVQAEAMELQLDTEVAAVTQPTPLALAKQAIKDAHKEDQADKVTPERVEAEIVSLFWGQTSGSLGETSAFCWLIGGIFLLVRRTITVHVPLAVLGSALVFATIAWFVNPDVYPEPMVHLCSGGLMMCAFFIATDPVTCPLSKLGRVVFGIGVGALVMLIRLKGGYPEGVMYAVLLMNSMTPLLDRWTRPRTLGGSVAKR